MDSIVSRLSCQERLSARKLLLAFEEAKNRSTVSKFDRLIVRPSQAWELNAANPFARVLLGGSLRSAIVDHFGIDDRCPIPQTPLYWITLADIECVSALDEGVIDIPSMVRKLRRGLSGLSFIGVIDVALYANIQPGTAWAARTGVSWHLHLFAWGEDRISMKRRAKVMNGMSNCYRPIIPRPQGRGFDWSQVTEENFVRRFLYMTKTPRSAYRIGRIEEGDEVRFRSNKSELRDGQRITMFHLLKTHLLDDLIVAGGEGIAIRRRAIKRALSRVR